MPIRAVSQGRLANRVDGDRQRLGNGRLGKTEPLVDLEAVLLGHDEKLGETAFGLAGATQKAVRATGILAAGAALVARAAGHRRLDGDAIAGADPRDAAADFDDDAGAFMAHREGIPDDLAANAAGRVIVDVGPTDADCAHADQHVGRLADLRIRRVAERHRAEAGEGKSFHRMRSLRDNRADSQPWILAERVAEDSSNGE